MRGISKKAYRVQRNLCNSGYKLDALGVPVQMKLTFEEWQKIWIDSGHHLERGTGAGQYVMSRKNDIGHYELGNVVIQLSTDNIREAQLGRPSKVRGLPNPKVAEANKQRFGSTEYRKEHANKLKAFYAQPGNAEMLAASQHKRYSKPDAVTAARRCTNDFGKNIYNSQHEMMLALGRGIHGVRSESFRWVLDDGSMKGRK